MDNTPGSKPSFRPGSSIEFLNENQVAQRLNVSIATVRRWRMRSMGPPFKKIGASVRYATDELKSWVDSRPSGGEEGAQ
jgi:predicted DNA-binding transcriptional regulator AlpA